MKSRAVLKPKFVIIASEGLTTDLLTNRLSDLGTVSALFIEPHEPKSKILKRRLKKEGGFRLMGQLIFLKIILPLIPNRQARKEELIKTYELKAERPFSAEKIQNIDLELARKIQELNPDFVFINGTTILKKEFIAAINCPILNIHVGITPKYRGVHGGFWAVYKDDLSNFGVTLHFVDPGIDTGSIIAQRRITPTAKDNFKTYPILQYCAGLELVKENMPALINNQLQPVENIPPESHLYYHPTWIQYLFGKGK